MRKKEDICREIKLILFPVIVLSEAGRNNKGWRDSLFLVWVGFILYLIGFLVLLSISTWADWPELVFHKAILIFFINNVIWGTIVRQRLSTICNETRSFFYANGFIKLARAYLYNVVMSILWVNVAGGLRPAFSVLHAVNKNDIGLLFPSLAAMLGYLSLVIFGTYVLLRYGDK